MLRNPVELANTIGRPHGVRCDYVFDSDKRVWCWQFYHNRVFVKRVFRHTNVLDVMQKIVDTLKVGD